MAHPLVPTLNHGGTEIQVSSLPPAFSPHNRADDFLLAVKNMVLKLSSRLLGEINCFRQYGNSAGAILVKNLPIEYVNLPPTPATPTSDCEKSYISEALLMYFASLFGRPVGYEPEHGGSIVQNILPVASNATTQQSTSSSVVLAFHTEQAFHPYKPRFLFLLCLRGDPNATTTLCSFDHAKRFLSQTTLAILQQPLFRTKPDSSFLPSGVKGEYGEPMVVYNAYAGEFTFDDDLMIGTTQEAQQALEQLRDVVRSQCGGVVLTPGDLLVVDNNAAVHGRSPFKARFDGTDRWLQRAFVVDAEKLTDDVCKNHVVTMSFA